MGKSKVELKEIIVDSFTELFLKFNPSYDKLSVKEYVRRQIKFSKGRSLLIGTCRKYLKNTKDNVVKNFATTVIDLIYLLYGDFK